MKPHRLRRLMWLRAWRLRRPRLTVWQRALEAGKAWKDLEALHREFLEKRRLGFYTTQQAIAAARGAEVVLEMMAIVSERANRLARHADR